MTKTQLKGKIDDLCTAIDIQTQGWTKVATAHYRAKVFQAVADAIQNRTRATWVWAKMEEEIRRK